MRSCETIYEYADEASVRLVALVRDYDVRDDEEVAAVPALSEVELEKISEGLRIRKTAPENVSERDRLDLLRRANRADLLVYGEAVLASFPSDSLRAKPVLAVLTQQFLSNAVGVKLTAAIVERIDGLEDEQRVAFCQARPEFVHALVREVFGEGDITQPSDNLKATYRRSIQAITRVCMSVLTLSDDDIVSLVGSQHLALADVEPELIVRRFDEFVELNTTSVESLTRRIGVLHRGLRSQGRLDVLPEIVSRYGDTIVGRFENDRPDADPNDVYSFCYGGGVFPDAGPWARLLNGNVNVSRWLIVLLDETGGSLTEAETMSVWAQYPQLIGLASQFLWSTAIMSYLDTVLAVDVPVLPVLPWYSVMYQSREELVKLDQKEQWLHGLHVESPNLLSVLTVSSLVRDRWANGWYDCNPPTVELLEQLNVEFSLERAMHPFWVGNENMEAATAAKAKGVVMLLCGSVDQGGLWWHDEFVALATAAAAYIRQRCGERVDWKRFDAIRDAGPETIPLCELVDAYLSAVEVAT
jgi:hypothetical protein